jgi:hypothetical protein
MRRARRRDEKDSRQHGPVQQHLAATLDHLPRAPTRNSGRRAQFTHGKWPYAVSVFDSADIHEYDFS